MLSRTARGGLAALMIATGVTWAPPAAIAVEPLGTECDYKVGINDTEPIDDGVRFYTFQLIRSVGSGFPPGATIELEAFTPITEPGPFQWQVGEDGTFFFTSHFGNPELPPTEVTFQASTVSDPGSCTDSVSAQYLGNLPFTDIPQSLFWQEILWLYEAGVITGCTTESRPGVFPPGPTYCVDRFVTRAEMATLLVRAFDLPFTETDHFTDDDGHKFEWSVNRLAAARVTLGCGESTFCPDAALSRAEMASFLVRLLDLPPTDTDYFDDDNSSTHEANINALRESGIGTGCRSEDPRRFCPGRLVTRGQMAAFLYRILS